MTEEQKQLTLGQVAEMKAELENNVKNLLNEFVEKTGVANASVNASFEAYPQLKPDGTVIYDKHDYAQLRYSFNL